MLGWIESICAGYFSLEFVRLMEQDGEVFGTDPVFPILVEKGQQGDLTVIAPAVDAGRCGLVGHGA